MSLGEALDISVAPGAPLRAIVDAAREWGVECGPVVWCGDVALDPLHPAGGWPLVEGARLTPEPSLPCAPIRGVGLLVIAGPDAGHRATLGERGIVVGRGATADLRVADPALSRAHLHVRANPRLGATDLGSTNGSLRWRDRAAAIGRRRPLAFGDVLAVGNSIIAVVAPPSHGAESGVAPGAEPGAARGRPEPRDILARLAPLSGSVGGGLILAIVTGRWYLAITGLLYPAIVAWPLLSALLHRRTPPWDLDLVPSSLPSSRRAWSSGGPASLGIVGPRDDALGFARALSLALGRRPRSDGWVEPWMRWLPVSEPGDPVIEFVNEGDAPSWCDAVVVVSSAGCTYRRAGRVTPLPPVTVSRSAADSLARAIGAESAGADLPPRVRIADLVPGPAARGAAGPRRLVSPIGVSRRGTFSLDFDALGPHVLIAGTTGSGKSCLVETLVLGLAAALPPSDLSLALIDFKGGAGIRACVGLPHVRGVLTDLDPHLARRALEALAKELEDRKGALASAGWSSFAEWEAAGGAPPRLLVVADEYQELVAHYREFVPDLARLAAQGRSLGLHLVLATQRPAGAVTPEVRANVGTTIALRVASDAESRDLIGTGDAALLALDSPGRAIVATGGERTEIQVAIPCPRPTPPVQRWGAKDDDGGGGADLAAEVFRRWDGLPLPDPLWLPPLPADLGEGLPGDAATASLAAGVWLGLGDRPSERRQPQLFWDPNSGPLVVAGPPKSGRTTALRLVASQARGLGLRPVWLPADPREAARTVALASRLPDILLLVDDAPRALATLAEVDRGAPADALASLLAAEASIVVAMPLSGPHRMSSHATARLVLAGGDPTDEATWAIPRSLQGIAPAPGRGRLWIGGSWCECQVGRVEGRMDESLVAHLPTALDASCLGPGGGPAGDRGARRIPVGIGGDDGQVVSIDARRPHIVAGPPGPARSAASAWLRAAGEREGTTLDLVETDVPISARPDSAQATVVVTEPNPRSARDACRGDVDGLVDPRPPLGRVLFVTDGEAIVVQLARP